jgi:hypothetical protein
MAADALTSLRVINMETGVLLSATETRLQRVRTHLRVQRERLVQQARTWRASATMLGVNSALMNFPEIAARMAALASGYDRLAEADEKRCRRPTGARTQRENLRGLKAEIVGRDRGQ